jgi:hypothetical protein
MGQRTYSTISGIIRLLYFFCNVSIDQINSFIGLTFSGKRFVSIIILKGPFLFPCYAKLHSLIFICKCDFIQFGVVGRFV